MLTVSFVIQKLTHLCCFTSCSAFFLLPFLLLLLQLFNAFLQHIGPEITFKVRQLLGTCQPVLSRLFEDVLLSDTIPRTNKWRPLRAMGEPEMQSMLHWAAQGPWPTPCRPSFLRTAQRSGLTVVLTAHSLLQLWKKAAEALLNLHQATGAWRYRQG